MWENLKDFLKHYKSTFVKSVIALFFVFLLVHYHTYGKRSSVHSLYLQIRNGAIKELCFTHSSKIFSDAKGVYAVVDNTKIYIDEKWASLTPGKNLYIAIVMNRKRNVYEMDSLQVNMLLREQDGEGCRYFYNSRKRDLVK